jgi:hypothetical protein
MESYQDHSEKSGANYVSTEFCTQFINFASKNAEYFCYKVMGTGTGNQRSRPDNKSFNNWNV